MDVVLEGIKEKETIAELCLKYGMSQSMYYERRNTLFDKGEEALKYGCAWQHSFKTLNEAEEVIEEWIEYYNTKMRHSSLGYKTPLEYHAILRKLAA